MNMTKEEFDQFKHEAYKYLKAQQDNLMSEYDMGEYEQAFELTNK